MLHSLNLNKLVKSVLFKPGSGGIGNTAYRYVPENLEPPYWGCADVAEYFGITPFRVRQLAVSKDIGSCFQLPGDNRLFFYIEGTKRWLVDNPGMIDEWKGVPDPGITARNENRIRKPKISGTHGLATTYKNLGCRCRACKKANAAEYKRQYWVKKAVA